MLLKGTEEFQGKNKTLKARLMRDVSPALPPDR